MCNLLVALYRMKGIHATQSLHVGCFLVGARLQALIVMMKALVIGQTGESFQRSGGKAISAMPAVARRKSISHIQFKEDASLLYKS
jgi:hypothetical protein